MDCYLSDYEKLILKTKLINKMSEFLEDIPDNENKIGWLPINIERFMADAAFSVLETVNATNQHIIKKSENF